LILSDLVAFWDGVVRSTAEHGRYLWRKPEKAEMTHSAISEEISSACIPIFMTFNAWLLRKEIPDPDRLSMLIQQSGRDGIPENELRSRVELPKKLVDELLAALVQSRMVRVIQKEGKRFYASM
jgi:hypothetical protein